MSPELILVLRVLTSAALIAFLGMLFVMLWRDFHAVSMEVDTRTRRRGRLIVVRSNVGNPRTGTEFPLLPLTSMGRGTTNTVVLHDSFASAEHALMTLRGGRWWLEDRGSSNGTLLNGFKVEEPVIVSSGDIIGVGQVELKLELEE
jgi:hypothetical protein